MYKIGEWELNKMKAVRNYLNSDGCDYSMIIGGVDVCEYLCEDLSEDIERNIIPRFKEELYSVGLTDLDIFEKREAFTKDLPRIAQAIIDGESKDTEAMVVLSMYAKYDIYRLSWIEDTVYITDVAYSIIEQIEDMGYKKTTDTCEYTIRMRSEAIKTMEKLINKDELSIEFLESALATIKKGR